MAARKKTLAFIIVNVAAILAFWATMAVSFDRPHTSADLVSCNRCHQIHNAPGDALTNCGGGYTPDKADCNQSLCLSCHNASGGLAQDVPFAASMQAAPGIGNNSHRWDAGLPGSSSPGNAYGLRAKADLTNATLKSQLTKYGDVVTCSVCHSQHVQSVTPWDPAALTLTPGPSGNISNRHFMRMENDYNQMCEDCHYYRAMNYTKASGGDGGYPANGSNVFSHPVDTAYNQQGYDHSAPLDVNGKPQTGSPRYAGDADGVSRNNMVLDAGGKVRCLSCHRMHYVDSNAMTNDIP